MTTKPQSTTETLEPCPFCPARLSPFPKEHLSPDLHAVAGQWFQIVHNAGCFFTLLGFGDYPVHEERLAAWNTRSPASAAPVVDALCAALETAINSVECASVDSATGEELQWYKQAHEALRLAGRPWKGVRHE